MKILLVGFGAVASVICTLLNKEKKIEKIICGYRNYKRAKEFLITKSDKVELKKIDASNTNDIARAAKDIDLIINTSLPNFNLKIMDAALKVGANYQDLCSHLLDLFHAEQLTYHKKFEKKNELVGLINIGVAPGLSNLLAKDDADKMDEVDSIKIRFLEEQKTSEMIFAWSPVVTLDELISPPLVFENGNFKLAKPFGHVEEYSYPIPFGKRHAVGIYGDEVATIPLFTKVKNVDVKSADTDIEFAKALFRLGLFERKPVSIGKIKISPIEFFSSIMKSKTPTPKEMIRIVKEGIIEEAEFVLVVDVVGKEED